MRESLSHDPIHGYIPFMSLVGDGETSERTLLDHPWLQRLRQIHQLQTAWWVFPTAEHTRFQHVLGAMHLASRAVDGSTTASRGLPRRAQPRLRRVADAAGRPAARRGARAVRPFLRRAFSGRLRADARDARRRRSSATSSATCSAASAAIPTASWPPAKRSIPSRSPCSSPGPPITTRPTSRGGSCMLRSLFSGLYTVDNMDFVLRDAYMSGYSTRAFDLDRLLHYSFFSEQGLTIHSRGLSALVRFMRRGRIVPRHLLPSHRAGDRPDARRACSATASSTCSPAIRSNISDEYQQFTEWSLLVDVARWHEETTDSQKQQLGVRWQQSLASASRLGNGRRAQPRLRRRKPSEQHLQRGPRTVRGAGHPRGTAR